MPRTDQASSVWRSHQTTDSMTSHSMRFRGTLSKLPRFLSA